MMKPEEIKSEYDKRIGIPSSVQIDITAERTVDLIIHLSKTHFVMMDEETKLLKILHGPGKELKDEHLITGLGFKHKHTSKAPIYGQISVYYYPEKS